MAIEITVPTLGESVADATVARWIKTTGDAVAADEPVDELETDKVTLEVPAPAAGTLGEIIAAEGASVEVGASLAILNEGDAPVVAKAAPVKAEQTSEEPVAAPVAEAAPSPASTRSTSTLSFTWTRWAKSSTRRVSPREHRGTRIVVSKRSPI